MGRHHREIGGGRKSVWSRRSCVCETLEAQTGPEHKPVHGPQWNQKGPKSGRVNLEGAGDPCLPMFTLLYGRVADYSWSKPGWVCAPHALCCLPENSALPRPLHSPPTVWFIVPRRSWCSWKLVVSLIFIEVLIVLRGM